MKIFLIALAICLGLVGCIPSSGDFLSKREKSHFSNSIESPENEGMEAVEQAVGKPTGMMTTETTKLMPQSTEPRVWDDDVVVLDNVTSAYAELFDPNLVRS